MDAFLLEQAEIGAGIQIANATRGVMAPLRSG
jgi:hypothetical protein